MKLKKNETTETESRTDENLDISLSYTGNSIKKRNAGILTRSRNEFGPNDIN